MPSKEQTLSEPAFFKKLRRELGSSTGRHLATLAGDLQQPILMHQLLDAGRQVECLPRLETFDVFQHVPRIRLDR